jgi:prevent-host-death family protein
MRSVSAAEARQDLDALLHSAQSEPVVIRQGNRDIAVVVSPPEYERLRAIDIGEFERFCDRIGARAAEAGLTEARVAEFLSEPAPGCATLPD